MRESNRKDKSASQIRNKQLKDLVDCIQRCAVTDVIVSGGFNESVSAEK